MSGGVRRVLSALSPGNIGIVYLTILIVIGFSLYLPDLFLTRSTLDAILNSYALYGIASLAVLVPMTSGAIDASIAGNISLTSVCCAQLFATTSLPPWAVVIVTLAIGASIGLVNVFVLVTLRIPAIIGTLAVGLTCDALSVWVSGNQILSPTQLSGGFGNVFALDSWNNLSIPIAYLLLLATIIGVLLTQTPAGRYVYAVGLNPDVARDTGIRVRFVQARALVIGGILGAFAGLVLSAQIAGASPGSGDQYLLPAFAAVFLGATQFRLKRFTAWGTIIAVFMIGTVVYGLQLAGAPTWTPNVFEGVTLILAIAISNLTSSKSIRAKKARRRRSPGRAVPAAGHGSPPAVVLP